MSKHVDERVVEMQFDNKQFEQGIAQSIKSLERMEKSLDKMGASSAGIQQLTKNLNNVDFGNLSSNIDRIANRFTLLGNLADQFRTRISNTILNFGKTALTTVYSLTKSGGINRALNIEAAKFQLEGLKVKWDEIEDDINYGVKDTAYGLDAAAKVASQLVASQVAVGDDMKMALRGISGVAAMTNSTYEDIGRVYTQIAGNGRLMGQQLLQLSSRGMNAAATIAEYLGTTEAEVRSMVSKGQIDFATFSAAMDSAFGEHAKEANKTFTGALSNVKAALSRIGAAVASSGINDLRDIFNELIPLINKTKVVLMPTIDAFNSKVHYLANRLEYVIWFIANDEPTLNNLVGTFVNLGKAIMSIVTPILRAFGIFVDGSFAGAIASASERLYNFTKALILPADKGRKLTTVLRTILGVIKTIASAIKAVITVLSPLVKLVTGFVDGIFTFFDIVINRFQTEILGKIDKTGAVDKIETAKNAVDRFVTFVLNATKDVPEKLANVVIFVAKQIKNIGDLIANIKMSDVGIFVGKVVAVIGAGISKVISLLKKIPFNQIKNAIKSIFQFLEEHINKIVQILSHGKFESIGDLIGSIGDRLNGSTKGIEKAATSLEKVSTAVEETDKSVGSLLGKFTTAKTSMGRMILGIAGVSSEVGTYTDSVRLARKATEQIEDVIDNGATKTINENIKETAGTVKDLLHSLYEGIGAPDPGSILGLALGGTGALAIFQLSRALRYLGDFAQNAKGAFGIKDFLVSLGSGIKSYKVNAGRAEVVKSLAIAIGVFTAAIIAIAIAATKYDVLGAARIIETVLGMLMGVLFGLSVLDKSIKENITAAANYHALALLMIALGAAVLEMSEAVKILMTIDWNNISWKAIGLGVGSFAAIIGSLLGVFLILAKNPAVGGSSLGAVLGLIGIVVAIGRLMKAIKVLDDYDVQHLNDVWKSVARLIVAMTASLVIIGFSGPGMMKAGVGIFLMTQSIITVLLAIAIISAMMKDANFVPAMMFLATIVTTMGFLIVKLGKAALFAKDVSAIGKAFLGIGASIALIAVAMALMTRTIENNKLESCIAAFGMIEALVVTFGFVGKTIASAGKNADQFAKTFVAIGAAILLMSVSIAILSVLDPARMWLAGALVLAMMGMVVLIIKAIKYAQPAIKEMNAGKMTAMVAAFAVMVGAFAGISILIVALYKHLNSVGGTIAVVVGAIAAIGVMLFVMAKSAEVASKIVNRIDWKGLLAMAGVYVLLAGSIIALSQLGGTPDQILQSVLAITGSLMALAVVAKVAEKITKGEGIAAIVALAVVFTALSVSMAILAHVNADEALANAGTLALVMLALLGIGKLAEQVEGGSGVAILFIMSASVIALAAALRILGDTPWQTIVAGGLAIVAMLAVLAIAGMAISSIAAPVAAAAVALLLLAAVPVVLAAGLWLGAKAVDAFSDTLVNLGMRAPAILASIRAIAYGIISIVAEVIATITGMLGPFGAEMSENATAIAEHYKAAMKEASDEAKSEEAGYQAAKRMAQGASEAAPEMESAGSSLMDAFSGGLTGSVGDLKSVGSSLIGDNSNGLLGGITSGFGSVKDAGLSGMNDFTSVLNQSDAAKEAGGFTLQGFLDGTPNSSFYDQGASNANAYNTGFQNSLNINSPSKEMTKNGEYTMAGFEIGLANGLPNVIQAAYDIAANIKSAIGGADGDAESAGKNVAIGFNNGLCSPEVNNKIIQNAQTIASNVINILRSAFEIHSPSKVTEQLGEYVGEGFNIGLTTSFKKAQQEYARNIQWFVSYSNSAVKTMASKMQVGGESMVALSKYFGRFVESQVGTAGALNAARTAITRFIDANYRATDAYEEHMSTIKALERQIDELSSDMQGNAQEISDCFDKIRDEAQSMAEEAARSFKELRNNIKSTLTGTVKLMNQSLDSGLDLLANFSKKSKALIPTINGGTFAEDLSAALSGDQVFDSSAVENSVEAAIRTMEENIEKFEKQNANYDKALSKGLNEKFLKSLKDMGEDGEDIIAGFAEASTDDIAKANSLWAKKQQYANEALKKSLQGSIDAMEEWSYDLTRLAQKGVDEGLLREIAEAGPEAQAYLDALLSMTDSELRQFSNLYSNAQNLAISATDQAIAAMAVNGALAAGSFAKAISDYDLLANSEDIAYNYIAFLEGMGVEMNDTAWTVGRDAILALAKGLLDEEAIDTATSNASSAGSSIGKAMSDGVASGGKEAEKQFEDLSINWNGRIDEIATEIQHKIINSDGTINEGIAEEMRSIGGFTDQQIYDLAVLARDDLANGGGYQVYWGARDMFYQMKQAGIDENSPEWLKRYVEETTDAATPTQTHQRKVQSGYDALCNKAQFSLQTEGAKSKTEARDVTAGVTKELTPTVTDTSKVKTGVKKLDNDGVQKPLKESNSPAIAKQTGEYTGDGYAQGLLSKIPAVTAAATALASAANRAMQSTAMVASPSKFTKWLGNMIGDGFVVGMKAKEDAVGAEAQHIADASLSAFQDSVKTALMLSNELSNNLSMSPSIRPVIDLDSVRTQALEMNSILGNEDGSVSMRLASNVDDGLIRSLQTSEIMRRSLDEYQKESTSQMSQLSSNFDGLREDLANLETAMSGMAIVMDSGELVGAITTGIDAQLGKNVKYSKRGLA